MESFARGILGLGVTLFVVAAAVATINGVVRTYAAKRLAQNQNDATGGALVLLF